MELGTIPRSALSAADQVHYDVFGYQYAVTVQAYSHRFHLIRTATYDGIQNTEQLVDNLRFSTVKDYEDWLSRLETFPAYLDQNIALLREGVRTRTLLPKVIVSKVLPQIATLATQAPTQSGFYKPFIQFPDNVAVADRTRLAAAGVNAVRTKVQPAFATLKAFLESAYLPACPARVGSSHT